MHINVHNKIALIKGIGLIVIGSELNTVLRLIQTRQTVSPVLTLVLSVVCSFKLKFVHVKIENYLL